MLAGGASTTLQGHRDNGRGASAQGVRKTVPGSVPVSASVDSSVGWKLSIDGSRRRQPM